MSFADRLPEEAAFGIQLNRHGSGWMRGISLQKFVAHALTQEASTNLLPKPVGSSAARDHGPIAKQMRQVGEVRWSSAQLTSGREQVP